MGFPIVRPRRMRGHEMLRKMFSQTSVCLEDMIYPLFAIHGSKVRNPISSMPGIFQLSVDQLLFEMDSCVELGINSILLFGIPAYKDECGSSSWDPQGPVPQAIRAIKQRWPQVLVTTDICLCEYTDHGHCGVVEAGKILNDPSLSLLARMALCHAEAGADVIAPSDMMDGRVGAIRRQLDEQGFLDLPIMAYSAKYASGFYGPFREAAESAPQFGDRRSYQMNPANSDEALREVALDLEEGADIVMVKPALPYLDIINRVKEKFGCPLAAYNVSGEYSMVKAAAERGWVDEKRVVWEMLTSIKRAGADSILTYFAPQVARWIREDNWN